MHYSLSFADPAGHLVEVTCRVDSPRPVERMRMPAWIPGSYLIRDFARHVVSLEATQAGRKRPTTKIDKATWQIDCEVGCPLIVRYQVYAWDRSVRGCYFDSERAFVNPAACLLERLAAADEDTRSEPLDLDLLAPAFDAARAWRCATTLEPIDTDARGFGRYRASDYTALIEHPIECAAFDEIAFEAGGVPHRIVVSGRHRGDLDRLARDSAKICAAHCELFGGSAPFQHYLFLLHVVDEGYGGLEHRSSTALIAPRNDLPVAGDASVSEGYLGLLGLISHEYFHAWNVKRIRPAAFTPECTASEAYTRLLWLFEGFTSYYDELMLARAGLISEDDYLRLIGRHLTQLLRTPGRRRQSLAEASFDAWIKYYRADENAPNSQASYYVRGGLVALALDLTLRATGASTLDEVMQGLWQRHGKTGVGVPEEVAPIFSELAGCDLGPFFARYIDGTDDPDWATLFEPFGVTVHLRAAAGPSDRGGRPDPEAARLNVRQLGIVLEDRPAALPVIRHVLAGSAAHRAGLSAGDTLVAIDGLRAGAPTLSKHLARFEFPCSIDVRYFRHDVLKQTMLTIERAPLDTAWLTSDRQRRLAPPWLQPPERSGL